MHLNKKLLACKIFGPIVPVLLNPPFLAVDYCAKWLGLQIQFQTLCYKLSYIELASYLQSINCY